MLVRISKDTFIRNYNNNGYIVNQLTNKDIIFNETGIDFLTELTRIPQEIKDIVNRLLHKFGDVDYETLFEDYFDFLKLLEDEGFVLLGNSPDELDKNEPFFSYKNSIIKTDSTNSCKINEPDYANTETYIYHNLSKEYHLKSVALEITRCCNENCLHCYIPERQRKEGTFLSYDEAVNYMDQAANMGVLALSITGGEPFLNKDINKILLYARKRDFQISILSNLTQLKDSNISILKTINPTLIQASLYSMNPDVHDKITQVTGSQVKTLNAVKKLIENDIPVQISTPVMKYNFADYKEVLMWAKKNRIRANTDINIMGQTDLNTENLIHSPDAKQVKYLLKSLLYEDDAWKQQIIDGYGKGIESDQYSDGLACGIGIDSIYISSEGKLYPCASWQDYVLGDLKNDSLKHLWQTNENIQNLRNIKIKDFKEFVEHENKEFMSVCMARNANANNGNYMKIPKTVFEHAEITRTLADEF
jgi:radical SAM protein with 4Fe4S-binding SPASM domain